MSRLLLLFGNPGFSPPGLPGLTLWLDADHDASFSVDAVSGAVASWTSRDANARVFTPVSGAATTRLIRARKPNWNGRNVVVTQMTANTGLSCPSYRIDANFGANGKDITVIAAVRSDEALNASSFGTLYYHYASGAVGHYFRPINSVGNVRWLCLNSSTHITGSNANYLFREHVICLQRNNNTLTSFIDGKQEATASSTATAIDATSAAMFIGCTTSAGSGFHGDVAELIIYNRALSQAERYAVEDYLARKWFA